MMVKDTQKQYVQQILWLMLLIHLDIILSLE